MLRAIKLPGNKIYTGETIEECIANAKNVGAPPMSSIAGWINEEGTFVTEKPSETIENSTGIIHSETMSREEAKRRYPQEFDNMEKAEQAIKSGSLYNLSRLNSPNSNSNYFIKPKKGLKYLWNKIMNYKVKI